VNSPESAIRAYFTGLNGSDAERTVATFHGDGSLMAEEVPTATGHEQLRQFFTGLFKTISFGRELHIDRIIEEGDLATAQTHTTGTLTMLEPNTTISLTSRELFVLRKTGSEWRIVDYMFSHPERAES
jgi:ketosteroid isomerase-like protein